MPRRHRARRTRRTCCRRGSGRPGPAIVSPSACRRFAPTTSSFAGRGRERVAGSGRAAPGRPSRRSWPRSVAAMALARPRARSRTRAASVPDDAIGRSGVARHRHGAPTHVHAPVLDLRRRVEVDAQAARSSARAVARARLDPACSKNRAVASAIVTPSFDARLVPRAYRSLPSPVDRIIAGSAARPASSTGSRPGTPATLWHGRVAEWQTRRP